MAVLTAAIRKGMPSKEFGVPGKKMFPMPDKEHAQLALDFVGRSEAKGRITPAEADAIRRMAHAKLAE